MTETICNRPGSEPGAGEWCREYCPNYGSGRCRWDPYARRMIVTLPEKQTQLEVE